MALTAAALMMAAPLAATADPAAKDDPRLTKTSAGRIDSSFTASSLNGDQMVKAIVELQAEPVAVVQSKQTNKLSKSQKDAITKSVKNGQTAVVSKVKSKGGRVDAQMASAYNGVKIEVKRKELAGIASLPGVVAIHPVVQHSIDNAVSVPFLGAPQVWQSTGYTGQNVKVAVIDTGIDYTHADFAGAGTKAAYDFAKANEAKPADPNQFGPTSPRVKGGIDLVGDAYNANTPGSVPKPDPNPLDCYGHGTHVAGTIGGGGVTEDGKAYTGPYNEATATKKWAVGPGVAPKVDLYAVRVFGCAGTTDVTTEAIDWAVANDMDVINMSLGSTYGQSNDTSAVAASNATAAGVVVVASAGNSGPNPYLAGSPGNGKGVISVAAIDSTASFPGATLTFGSTTLNGINANGAPLPTTPYTVVVLKDDPATTENEALGCSVEAYTKNGISADPAAAAQIAVTTRGTCARAARPFFGQKAGADAVVMINTDANYPPYEGPITENPDTGEALVVTIPFIGVRSVDGAALRAAGGQSLTLAATQLANPGFRKAASFSSGGPGSGDSSLNPSVAAPGVSIVSAGVGTGNGPATNSGTSMAAPHVAGVAALTIQSHPSWNAQEITNMVVSSADASGLNDYRLTLEGNGLVDLSQSVFGTTYATGDTFRTNGQSYREPELNFGFRDLAASGFSGKKTVTLVNKGNTAKTYKLSSVASPQSAKATVTVSPSSVTIPARGRANVTVTMVVAQNRVPSSTADAADQFNFHEVSGRIVATAGQDVVAVPYLMVPRANSNVKASTNGKLNQKKGPVTVTLNNPSTAIAGTADFYTLGLVDEKGEASATEIGGVDLKALGVQSFAQANGDQLLVFAVNTHSKYTNAASIEFDIPIDTNGDGNPDFVVLSVDSGLVRNDDPNGVNEVFIVDNNAGGIYAAGFMAVSPTDSSTVLLPVMASDIGLDKTNPSFTYTAASYFIGDGAVTDQFAGAASYNPWFKPLDDGMFVPVKANGQATTTITVNEGSYNLHKPLGALVVVLDNKAANEGIQILGKPTVNATVTTTQR